MTTTALRRADQLVVLDRAAVGVELLARLEQDGVHAALRVGELHPVADFERPSLDQARGPLRAIARHAGLPESALATSTAASTP